MSTKKSSEVKKKAGDQAQTPTCLAQQFVRLNMLFKENFSRCGRVTGFVEEVSRNNSHTQ
jgi:hypothetical protein